MIQSQVKCREQDYISLKKVSNNIDWNKITSSLQREEDKDTLFQIDNISQNDQPVSAISLVSHSPLRNSNIC